MKKFFKKHVAIIILMVIVLVFPIGISNQARINMRTLVTGVAIDKEGDEYTVTAQIVKTSPGQESPGSSAEINFISDSAKTLAEAVSRLSFKAGKASAFSHTSFIIVGKEASNEDVSQFLDYFVRDKILKNSALVLFSNEKAEDEIKKTKNLELSVGVGLQKVFLYKEKESDGVMVTVLDFLNDSHSYSNTAVASVISLKPSEAKSQDSSSSSGSSGSSSSGMSGESSESSGGQSSGSSSGGSGGGSGSSGGSSESQNAKQNFEAQAPIAVFVKGKMVGKLEDEESDGFLLANPNSKVSNLELNEIECNCNMDKTQMKISVQIKSKNNSAKIRFENEIPCLDLFVDIKNAEIKEVISSDIHSVFTTEEYIAIKQTIKEKVSELIGKCFEKAQTLNADVFKAYEIAYKYHYDTLMKYYDTPEEFVKNLKLNVDVRTQQLEY